MDRGLAQRVAQRLKRLWASKYGRIGCVLAIVAVVGALVLAGRGTGGLSGSAQQTSPGIWELSAPEAQDDGLVVELSPEQRSHATSASFCIVRKERIGYHAVLLDVPATIDESGRVVVPKDPSVLAVVTNGGAHKLLMGATCKTDKKGKLHYTSDQLRLCATGDLADDSYSAGYEVVALDATFDASGQPKTEKLTREEPPYPLGEVVKDDERALYTALFYGWKSSLSKARAADGTMAPVASWPGGGSLSLDRAFCDEGFDFALMPLSSFEEEFYVQVLITDDKGDIHATDLSDALDLPESKAPTTVDVSTDRGTMTFELAEDHATLVSYEGKDAALEVPARVRELPVTAVGDSAFRNNEYLKSLVLPKGISSIGGSAFRNVRITRFSLPAGLTHIGPAAFVGMARLEEFVLEDKNDHFLVRDGVLFSADGKTLLAYPSAKGDAYTVPQGVTTIGHAAFARTPLVTVELPDSLVEIETCAFMGCALLGSLELPKGLERIGSCAFDVGGSYGADLSSLYAPVKTVALGSKVSYIGRDAFGGLGLESFAVDGKNTRYKSTGGFLLSKDDVLLQAPTSLRGMTVVPEGTRGLAADSLTNILMGTREENTLDYADVYLPSSVVDIHEEALPASYASSELERDSEKSYAVRLHVPEGSWAERFAKKNNIAYDNYCDAGNGSYHTKTIKVPKAKLGFRVYGDHAILVSLSAEYAGHVEVPETVDGVPVTGIGEDNSDKVSGGVATLMLPASVRDIDGMLIHSITGLRRIHMPANDWLMEKDGVLYSSDGLTLVVCPNAYGESFEVPEGTQEIGDGAFMNAQIGSITLPEGVERIGATAFRGTSEITSIEFPSTLRSIGPEAFSFSSLTSVRLNEGLEAVGYAAFQWIKGYEGLSIPNSVTALGHDAFAAEDYGDKPMTLGSDTLHIGTGLEEVYDQAFDGLEFQSFEVDPGNSHLRAEGPLLLSADGRVLYACAGGATGEVHVPEGVEEIISGVFENVPGVTDIYLPKSLLRMSEYAFGSLYSLRDSLTIHCPKGSEAEALAQGFDIDYATYDEEA